MEDKQLELLKKRIPMNINKYSDETEYEADLEILLEDTKNIALSELYPFKDNFDGLELPSKYYNWQLRACKELDKLAKISGVKKYSELNLSWERGNDGPLSNTIMQELTPHAGVPERRSEDDN